MANEKENKKGRKNKLYLGARTGRSFLGVDVAAELFDVARLPRPPKCSKDATHRSVHVVGEAIYNPLEKHVSSSFVHLTKVTIIADFLVVGNNQKNLILK